MTTRPHHVSPSAEDDFSEESRPSKRPRPNPSIEIGLMRDGSGRDPASFVGSASGIHFIRSVYSALKQRATARHATNATPESNVVPGEDDKLETSVDTGSPTSLWHSHEISVQRPDAYSFDDLLRWTSSYFDVWHPAFPFLLAPSILDKFETLTNGGIMSLNPLDRAIVRAIVSISLADRRQSNSIDNPIPTALVFSSFEEALDAIRSIITKPATLQSLQAAVSVQLFLVSMLRLNAASRLGGLIIRVSYQLGLHRCPAQFEAFGAEEQGSRRRLFWSIYCIDRYICHALGLPLTIRDDDVDVCRPDHERHVGQRGAETKSVTMDTAVDPRPKPDDRLRLLTLLSKHAEIKGLIMELRNKRVERRADSQENALSIQAELTRWWNEVEDSLEQAEVSGTPLSTPHQTVLRVVKHECVISLNRPLLASSKDSANYAAALQSCISASKSIIKALHTLAHPAVAISSIDEQHAPLFYPSFTWSIWMSAFILLYAALEGEVDYEIAVR
jgi:hypothetical protein